MFIKFFAFLLLLAIVNSMSIDADTEKSNEADMSHGRKCVPGAHYFDGCNWCVCHQGATRHSEHHIGCTLKACQVYNPKSGTFETHTPLPAPDSFWEKSESY